MAAITLPWAEMLASAVASGGGIKLLDFLANRGRSKAFAMGAVDHAVQTAFGGMETVVNGLSTEVGRLSTDVAGLRRQHEQCTDDLTAVRHRLDVSEADRTAQRAEIDLMMTGSVPGYISKKGAP